ncbi:MAG TPA: rhodanese-like domain-containing protein [Pyrinomonadaceae bacterium]|nr:rhodanese-like domain-containing protein [Pyrinomonadaceae bacterium]
MTKVTVEEVEKRLNNGQETTIVDSRSAHAWDEAEVKAGGAVRIPPDEVEKHIADISRDDYIVTYCT